MVCKSSNLLKLSVLISSNFLYGVKSNDANQFEIERKLRTRTTHLKLYFRQLLFMFKAILWEGKDISQTIDKGSIPITSSNKHVIKKLCKTQNVNNFVFFTWE